MHVPMERAQTGTHHAAGKERFAVGTGRPVQPHEALPHDYEVLVRRDGCGSHCRSPWPQTWLLREAADVQGGARMGAAPWILGMLATLLLVFDLFVGTASGSEDLQATHQHVERAYAVFTVIDRIKEMTIKPPAHEFADNPQTRGDRRKEAEMRALQPTQFCHQRSITTDP